MNKNTVIGEMLYYLAIFEKCRRPSGHWSRNYVRSLQVSFAKMEELISLLEREDSFPLEEVWSLAEFMEQHTTMTKFPLSPGTFLTAQPIANAEGYKQVNATMRALVARGMELLVQWPPKFTMRKIYKQQFFSLFGALHNLPRVYLNSSVKICSSSGEQPITVQQAFSYIESYLNALGMQSKVI